MNNALKETVKLTGWSLLLVLINFYIPILGVFAGFLWFVPLIIVAIKHGFNYALVGNLLLAILMAIFLPNVATLVFLAQYLIISVTYCNLFYNKANFSKLLVGGILAALGGAVIRILVTIFVLGINYEKWLGIMRKAVEEIIKLYQESGTWDQLQGETMSTAELKAFLYNFAEVMTNLTPAVLASYGMLVAFVGLIITIRILKKIGLPSPEIPQYSYWKLPWQVSWVTILGLALLLSGDYLTKKVLVVMGQNLLYLLLPFYLVTGLAITVYFFKKWKISGFFRIILLVIIVFNLPLYIMILLLIGLFDPLLNFRKIQSERG